MNQQSAIPLALLQRLKRLVIRKATRPTFVHHEWFVPYHLKIVERLAVQICSIYPEADKNLVLLLVWFHDYGKITDFSHEHEATLREGNTVLARLGFPDALVQKIIRYVKILDEKSSVQRAPLEVKIVSSADGASHLVGPFYPLYWKEHAERSIRSIMKENRRKAFVDWKQKIVLPEVKKAFAARHAFILEHSGVLPSTFFGL